MHIFPFTFTFPSSSRELEGENPPQYDQAPELPPSMNIGDSDVKASINYYLTVKVRRRGLLKPIKAKKKKVLFRVPNPHQLPLSSVPFYVSKAAALPPSCFQFPKGTLVQLELSASNPIVLYPMRPLFLDLYISAFHQLQQRTNELWLHMMLFHLITTTTVKTECGARSHIVRDTICVVKGPVSIASAVGGWRYDLNNGLWQAHKLPRTLPSFTLAIVSRMYKLEVEAWVSCPATPNMEV